MSTHLIYITARDEAEAKKIARTLVEEKLAACMNIIPKITSIYRWEDKVEEAGEAAIIGKTSGNMVKKAEQRVKELHSYDCPCFVAIKIDDGNKDFLKWVEDSVE